MSDYAGLLRRLRYERPEDGDEFANASLTVTLNAAADAIESLTVRNAAVEAAVRADMQREVRTVEARGVIFAQEELVRKDAFTERTLRILDDLAKRVEAGEFVSDLFTPSTPNQQGAEQK